MVMHFCNINGGMLHIHLYLWTTIKLSVWNDPFNDWFACIYFKSKVSYYQILSNQKWEVVWVNHVSDQERGVLPPITFLSKDLTCKHMPHNKILKQLKDFKMLMGQPHLKLIIKVLLPGRIFRKLQPKSHMKEKNYIHI